MNYCQNPTCRYVYPQDPETGHFFRDHKRADTPRRDGYARVTLDDGRRMLAHRAAFIFMTGSEAAGFVDHVNCDRGDNRWANLRTVDANGNQHNQRAAQRGNRCGLLGVSVHARGGFYSRIAVNGRSRYLGYFATAQEAHQAYVAAKRELHLTGTL